MLAYRMFFAALVCTFGAQAQQAARDVLAIQGAMEGGDLDNAAHLIENSLARNPHNGGVLNLRGVLHARRNELPEARTDFAEVVRINPQLTAGWQNLGRACEQLNDTDCSLDAWQHVVRSRPQDAEAHGALAQLYAEKQNFAESLRHLNLSKPDDLALRCLDLVGLGRIGEAKTIAARLGKQTDFGEGAFNGMHGPIDRPAAAEVVAVLVEGLDSRGAADWRSLRRLGVAYEQLHRPAEARKILERVAMLDPQQSAHLLELARLAEDAKDHEGALGYLAHARDLEPNNARIHFLFGAIAGEMNLPIEAKQSLDKALAIEPDNAEFNFAMGSVILKTRDAATAATYFAKYVQARPADARGHYALGLAYFAAGDYEHAAAEMNTARDSKNLTPAADYYLGRMARLDGNLEEATRKLHEALALQPKFSEPHTELGRIAMLRGDVDAARVELELAVRLSPESFQANEQLLVLYKRTNDARAAAQEELLKKLDEERSRRAELMLRTLEMRP